MTKKDNKKLVIRKNRRNLKSADVKQIGMKKAAKLGYGTGISRRTFKGE